MALRDANRRVTEAIKSIVGGLDRLAGLADMVAQGGSGNMQQSMYSIGGYLLDLNADHTRLHDAFPAKAQEEVSVGWLPSSTATVIQTTLSKIAAAAEALGKCLSADGGVVSGSGQHAVRGVPAQAVEACTQLGLVNELQVRAVGYMEKLRCDAPDTVPYTEALALKTGTTLNRLAPRATAASDSAVSAATIKSYQEKIAVLEQEREHSVLECQLLQMRVQALEGDDDGSGRGRTTAPTGSSSVDVGGENGSSAPNSKEISTIKKHYEERIQLLTTQLQFADSKAVTYYDECRSTALRLELLRTSQAKQGEEYKNVNGPSMWPAEHTQAPPHSHSLCDIVCVVFWQGPLHVSRRTWKAPRETMMNKSAP
eukprot:m.1309645 g.1309645  ORF g.1309645 m.1309645 type:complete len:369 (+) comp24824_c0_seq30:351-1457(+)